VCYDEHERHGRNVTSHEAISYALQALQGEDDLVVANGM
jgi:hypothetical protein